MSAVEAGHQDQPDQNTPSLDELKKDATTEDESSQDSKVDPIDTKAVTNNGDADIKDDEPANGEKEPEEEKQAAAENGKIEDEAENKEESADDVKSDKPEENGESHESGEKTEDDGEADADAEKKPSAKKEDTEDDEEVDEEEEEEEGEEEEGEEGEEKEKKEKKVKPAPKKVKKVKSGEDGEEDEEEEDDEEGDGELEDEEEIEGEEGEEIPPPKKKKEPSEPPVPVPAGKGIPLGHIPNVEIALSRFKIEDMKFLHQFLYNQLCRTNLIKRNIKKFKGYEFEKDSTEYKEKVEEMQKFEPKQLRMLCEMLDLDKRGSPNDLTSRIIGFCLLPKNQSPHARGAVKERPLPESTPGGRPRRSAAVRAARGYSDEEYESDPETKVKGPKAHRDESADSDGSYNPSGSGQDPDSDFDPAAADGSVTRKRKVPARGSGKGRRGRPKGSKGKKNQGRRGRGRKPANSESEEESESESGSEEMSDSEGEESDPLTSEPPSKRGRGAVSTRGRKPVAVKRKGAPAKKKSGPASMTKGRAAGKKRKASSSEDSDEGSVEEEEGSDEEGSSEEGSEEEQEAATPAKKAKHPPTDEEIKKYVEQILEGANLEEITMKTVCKQVYSHYPDFDLAHKKDFIKATVKSLISS